MIKIGSRYFDTANGRHIEITDRDHSFRPPYYLVKDADGTLYADSEDVLVRHINNASIIFDPITSTALTHQFDIGDKFEEKQGSTTFTYEILYRNIDSGGPYYGFSIYDHTGKRYPDGEYYEYVIADGLAKGDVVRVKKTSILSWGSPPVDLNSPSVWNNTPEDHGSHEVIENVALGKSFRYCRNCKKEVV